MGHVLGVSIDLDTFRVLWSFPSLLEGSSQSSLPLVIFEVRAGIQELSSVSQNHPPESPVQKRATGGNGIQAEVVCWRRQWEEEEAAPGSGEAVVKRRSSGAEVA